MQSIVNKLLNNMDFYYINYFQEILWNLPFANYCSEEKYLIILTLLGFSSLEIIKTISPKKI